MSPDPAESKPDSLDEFATGKRVPAPAQVDAKAITEQLYHALRERYCLPEWSLALEVGTGAMDGDKGVQSWSRPPSRAADGIAISNYRRTNHEWHGFEVKASRADWLNELKQGCKAEASMRWVNRWWLVTVNGVVREGEVPESWGLMLLNGRGLRVATQAPVREREPAPGWLLGNILSRFAKTLELDIPSQESIRQRIRNEERESASKEHLAQQRLLVQKREEYDNLIDTLATVTGLTHYDLTNKNELKRFGKFFRRAAAMADWENHIEEAATYMERRIKEVREQVVALRMAEDAEPEPDQE